MTAAAPLRIRRAVPEDAALLAELGARTFRDAFGALNDPAEVARHLATHYGEARQREEIANPLWTTLLAEVAGVPVGYAQSLPAPPPIAHPPAGAWCLRRLYLEQAWTGRGIGRPLLQAIIADARQRGATLLWLTTWERAAQAIAFYRKQGFVEAGRTTFLVGNDLQQDLVFTLRL